MEAALYTIAGAMIGFVIVSIVGFFRDSKAYGEVSKRGDLTSQNDRISSEIKFGSEQTERILGKLDSSVSSLVISDAEKKKDLEYLSKDQRQMLLSVEALGRDYMQKESEINRLLAKIAGFEERERNRNLRTIELEGIIRELSDELEALRCEEVER